VYKFGKTSTKRLATCHNDLQRLFNEVIKEVDCSIICGHRDEIAQEKAFADKKSKARWGQSNHNSSPSNAVDVMQYPIDWNDIERVKEFAQIVNDKANELDIDIKWGGDFKSFFDGPHYELVHPKHP